MRFGDRGSLRRAASHLRDEAVATERATRRAGSHLESLVAAAGRYEAPSAHALLASWQAPASTFRERGRGMSADSPTRRGAVRIEPTMNSEQRRTALEGLRCRDTLVELPASWELLRGEAVHRDHRDPHRGTAALQRRAYQVQAERRCPEYRGNVAAPPTPRPRRVP